MNAAPTSQLALPLRRRPVQGFAAALSIVVSVGKAAAGTAICPRCGRVGRVFCDFGVREVRGKRIPQSWCRECRAGRDSSSSEATHEQQGFLAL